MHVMASSDPSRPARLLASTNGLVCTEDHMFNLVDTAAPLDGGHRRPSAPGSRLVAVGPGPVLATFHSELEDNEPHVDLEQWTSAPPEPETAWEAHTQEPLAIPAGQLTLCSGVSALPAPHELTVPPGTYLLDVWCRGRAQARAAELDAINAATFPQGVERWLLRLWPNTGDSR